MRGEVRIEPRTDVEGRFGEGVELDCEGVGLLRIASLRGTQAEPILRFEGYEDRAGAEKLQGRVLRVGREEARRAAPGAYLWDDLIGMDVARPDGTELGRVVDVLRAGETDVLVVSGPGGELMLPALGSVVRAVDLASRRIVAEPQEELE